MTTSACRNRGVPDIGELSGFGSIWDRQHFGIFLRLKQVRVAFVKINGMKTTVQK